MRKSAKMLRTGHVIVLDGKPRKIIAIEQTDTGSFALMLEGGDVIRRTGGTKLEVLR